MPVYPWKCPVCGNYEETFQTIRQYDTHRNVPQCCGGPMEREITAPYVQADLPAYQAVAIDKATGKMPVIEGRKQHKEFLKRNGYFELGNEKVPDKPREVRGDFVSKQEVAEVTKQVLSKYNR